MVAITAPSSMEQIPLMRCPKANAGQAGAAIPCVDLSAPGAAAAAGAKEAAAPKVTKADATAAKEKRGIMKPVPVSEELSRFAGGAPELARSQVVKLIWAHIKANGLQVCFSP